MSDKYADVGRAHTGGTVKTVTLTATKAERLIADAVKVAAAWWLYVPQTADVKKAHAAAKRILRGYVSRSETRKR